MTDNGDADTIAGIRGAIDGAELTPRQSIDAAWARAREREPDLRAFAHLPETPPTPAVDGPLTGIPVGVKDVIDTADMPTAYGTRVLGDHRPRVDASVVTRLRDLGATVLGKTVSTEFAFREPGPTRNPWNPAHTPGGSSSGSAASVAAGILPLALGTQTIGSIIRPAAYCGVVGFKPTFGLLPRDGVHPLCSVTDTVGLLARTVDDIDVALRLLTGANLPDPAVPSPVTIGVLGYEDEAIEPAQHAAVAAAAEFYRDAGHTVRPLASPIDLDEAWRVVDTLLAGEAVANFGSYLTRYPEGIGTLIRDLVRRGAALSERDRVDAIRRREELEQAHARATEGIDVILTVPAAGEAPLAVHGTGDARFCAIWSLLRTPAVTVPVSSGRLGLPLGVQLVGRRDDDLALLRVAAALPSAIRPPDV
jgi:amidase